MVGQSQSEKAKLAELVKGHEETELGQSALTLLYQLDKYESAMQKTLAEKVMPGFIVEGRQSDQHRAIQAGIGPVLAGFIHAFEEMKAQPKS